MFLKKTTSFTGLHRAEKLYSWAVESYHLNLSILLIVETSNEELVGSAGYENLFAYLLWTLEFEC